MFAFDAGREPVILPRAVFARIAAVAAVFGLAGCASAPTHYAAQNVAVAQVVEVEGDGRPGQPAPEPRLRNLPDEPAEPFSKNYGGQNPSAGKKTDPVQPVNVPAQTPPKIPQDLPPVFRKKLMQAMADEE